MRKTLPQRMALLHMSLGLLVGWTAYFIFVIGATAYFDTELDRWMQPELPLRPPAAAMPDATSSITAALRYLQSQSEAQGAQRWDIELPAGHAEPHLRAAWRLVSPNRGMSVTRRVLLDYDGTEAPPARATGGGYGLYRLHVELRYLPKRTGFYVVGICAMGILLLVLTGIVIHRRIFKDFFTFRPARQIRSWLDAHSALGAVAIPYLLFMGYSGLVFLNSTYMPALFNANFGDNGRSRYIRAAFPEYPIPGPSNTAAMLLEPAHALAVADRQWGDGGRIVSYSVWNPGDANARIIVGRERHGVERGAEQIMLDGITGEVLAAEEPARSRPKRFYDAVLGIHEGNYAGAGLRALYFLAGLLGATVIATGLAVWIGKRLPERSPRAGRGIQIMQRINIGVIGGLPAGIAAYLLANRLLPTDFSGRVEWEIHLLFLTWLACITYSLVCRPARGWIGLLRIAATAFLLVPLINLATTDRHLLVTVPARDWGLAGVDMAAIALGIIALSVSSALTRNRQHERSGQIAAAMAAPPSGTGAG